MPREPKLDMLPDRDMKLSGSHFRKVVRRIESIVPLAGDNIRTEVVDSGIKIHLDAKVLTLNVCVDGSPSTISVYGAPDLEAFGV